MGTYVPPLAPQNFLPKITVVTSAWLNAIDSILQGNVPANGVYDPGFVSGQVQVTGPGGLMTSYGDLTFGLNLPTPGGNAPALLIGGAGKIGAWIITDEQIATLPGITLGITSGAVPVNSVHAGGSLLLFGGAADLAMGGTVEIAGGTSLRGPGGTLLLAGGNSGTGPAGPVNIIAGTTGSAGAGIKLYATNLNGIAGDISFLLGQPDIPHSVLLWTMSHTGALFPGNQGAGNPGDVLVSAGNLASPSWGPAGLSGQSLLTLSGALSSNPTAIFNWQTNGGFATIWCDGGASNTPTGPDDIIISVLPAQIRPSSNRIVMVSDLINSTSTGYFGRATVTPAGGIFISLASSTTPGQPARTLTGSWSTSGTKGIAPGWSITYSL